MNKNVQRGLSTRQRIIAVATECFATRSYDGTSIHDVLRESELSRGALYHHFKSKDELFLAVLEAIEAEITRRVMAAAANIADPATALEAGCDAWLEIAQEPRVRQIVLLDAPAVIGWRRWRELDERYNLGLLKAGVRAASKASRLRPELVDIFARMLLAALTEAALVTANAERDASAAKRARAGLRELIRRLLG